MAGIGFELRKLLAPASISGTARAYAYAGVISSGPWIISIFSIILLNAILQPAVDESGRTLFSTTITHAYALALILTGALQFVLNRFAADRLSDGEPEEILPSAFGAFGLTAVISLVVGVVVFGLFTGESVMWKIASIALLMHVSLIFVAANYLSVLRRYRRVVAGFAIGYGFSCLLGWWGATRWGITVGLVGFSAGHLILFAVLAGFLQRELASPRELASWKFLRHFRRFPELALCGLLYNFGIWIDKILFWQFSEASIQVSGILRASLEYDIAIYLSLLSIVPGLAVFFLRLETDFAESFQRFFRETNGGGSLARIRRAKDDMATSLRGGFVHLVGVQLVVTLSLLIYSGQIGNWLGIGALQVGIFRVTLVGAFLLMLFLALLTVLFYLDDRKGALMACLVFALGNAVLGLATLLANEAWYGLGFVAAAGAAMLVATWRVNNRLARFEYHVFLPEGTGS